MLFACPVDGNNQETCLLGGKVRACLTPLATWPTNDEVDPGSPYTSFVYCCGNGEYAVCVDDVGDYTVDTAVGDGVTGFQHGTATAIRHSSPRALTWAGPGQRLSPREGAGATGPNKSHYSKKRSWGARV